MLWWICFFLIYSFNPIRYFTIEPTTELLCIYLFTFSSSLVIPSRQNAFFPFRNPSFSFRWFSPYNLHLLVGFHLLASTFDSVFLCVLPLSACDMVKCLYRCHFYIAFSTRFTCFILALWVCVCECDWFEQGHELGKLIHSVHSYIFSFSEISKEISSDVGKNVCSHPERMWENEKIASTFFLFHSLVGVGR